LGILRVWGGECLRALLPLSVAFSHFHVVRQGVEAAHASRPCFDSRAPQVAATWSVAGPYSGFTSLTLLRSKCSRARCHSTWLWFLGRARSHARRGIEIASPLSMLQLPPQGCQEFEAHPGRDGVHDSICTDLFPAAGAAGAVSFQMFGTREDESLSFSPAPCAGASICAVGVMFPLALSVRALEMGLRSSTWKGKRRSC